MIEGGDMRGRVIWGKVGGVIRGQGWVLHDVHTQVSLWVVQVIWCWSIWLLWSRICVFDLSKASVCVSRERASAVRVCVSAVSVCVSSESVIESSVCWQSPPQASSHTLTQVLFVLDSQRGFETFHFIHSRFTSASRLKRCVTRFPTIYTQTLQSGLDFLSFGFVYKNALKSWVHATIVVIQLQKREGERLCKINITH